MVNINDDEEDDSSDSSDSSNSSDTSVSGSGNSCDGGNDGDSGGNGSDGGEDGGGGGDVAEMKDIDEHVSCEDGRDAHTNGEHASHDDTKGSGGPSIETPGAASRDQADNTAAQVPSRISLSLSPPPAGEEAGKETVPRERRDSSAATIESLPRGGEFSVGGEGESESRLLDEQRRAANEGTVADAGKSNALGTGNGGGDETFPPTTLPSTHGTTENSDEVAATAAATLPTPQSSADGALAGAGSVDIAETEERRRPSRRMSLKLVAQAVRKRSMSLIATGTRGRQYKGGHPGKVRRKDR